MTMTLKRFGELVVIAGGVVLLVAAAKTGGEFWLVPWRAFLAYQHTQELRYQRDSIVWEKVEKWVDYQNCKERRGRERCLNADRP